MAKTQPSDLPVADKGIDFVTLLYRGAAKRFFVAETSGELRCSNSAHPRIPDAEFPAVTHQAAAILLKQQEELDTFRSQGGVMNYTPDKEMAERAYAGSDGDLVVAMRNLEALFPQTLKLEPWRRFRIHRFFGK